MAKDLWEADTFEGEIYIRLSFWHDGRKGGCMRAVSVVMWNDLKDQKVFLDHALTEMAFDKATLIQSL